MQERVRRDTNQRRKRSRRCCRPSYKATGEFADTP
jgi:hypothetical protein